MMFVSERNGSAFRIFKYNPNDCAFLRFQESHFHFLPKLSKVIIKNLKRVLPTDWMNLEGDSSWRPPKLSQSRQQLDFEVLCQ